ncbi:hypothetical protein EXU85_30885 [Spirosoma sp. KCTC 42546]|uniref:hypothetical protein n=1 Tax=Spirosoma sp. KCTC 42546 TaxID=2520506 RepID=UPI0011582C51|nr:hypothetical protein [Spirosoma sp. KCTC 42546]QDK82778.1 hypothetical protein EXU85_30885 [Spirosoma sp. KCTC 42546]
MPDQDKDTINLQVSGEVGKYNSLPVDYLVEIAKNLQTLLQTLAKVNVSEGSTIDLNNFKIELTGFKAGSAVPQFSFTHRHQLTLNGDVDNQRELVRQKFDELVEASGKGDFIKVRELYPDAYRRNEVVDGLYNFVNSFGGSPVNVVSVKQKKGKDNIVPLYNIRPFAKEVRDRLVTPVIENKELETIQEVSFKKVVTTYRGDKKINSKTIEEYSDKQASLSLAPDMIISRTHIYHLFGSLRCLLEKEDDYYVMTCEILDLVGTGSTIEEAEQSFAEEFEFVYNRYNTLPDAELTKRLQSIKTILNALVKQVDAYAHA